MAGSLVAVGAVYYVVQATASDGDLLDLDNIELSQSSLVVATDPDTGAQVEYATLRSSNSHRVWADLEQIPTNLQYAFICTEDKDFYNEPGVNFKRTIGAMINEYLLPIYSSKQGASTLEQQLIKNLTSDKSASGIEGALRKLREIYRALILSRSYSKETILEAYLNTISFTGTIQGVPDGGKRVLRQGCQRADPLECASIASITKNPPTITPTPTPRTSSTAGTSCSTICGSRVSSRRMITAAAAAQPLVLAETDKHEEEQLHHLLLHRCPLQRGGEGHHGQGGRGRVHRPEYALHRRLHHRGNGQPQDPDRDGEPDAQHRRCLLPGRLA